MMVCCSDDDGMLLWRWWWIMIVSSSAGLFVVLSWFLVWCVLVWCVVVWCVVEWCMVGSCVVEWCVVGWCVMSNGSGVSVVRWDCWNSDVMMVWKVEEKTLLWKWTKTQEKCGSCYAFASTGMLESRFRIHSDNQIQVGGRVDDDDDGKKRFIKNNMKNINNKKNKFQ